MHDIRAFVTWPLLVAFVVCCTCSTVAPSAARAGTWHTVFGIFGAVTGAALLATLASSFGPIGLACAGIVGAGLGFAGGGAIGALLGGSTGSRFESPSIHAYAAKESASRMSSTPLRCSKKNQMPSSSSSRLTKSKSVSRYCTQ